MRSPLSVDERRLDELARRLPEMARDAGAIHMRHWGRLARTDIDFKGRRDLLTVADRESEASIIEAIHRHFPGDAIFAEESGASPGFRRGDEAAWTWFVDPLDGTTNFAHGLPLFATAIGVLRGAVPIAGCVHAARLDETFLAVHGRGTTMNGAGVRTSKTADLRDAMLATGFAYKIEELEQDNVDNFGRLVRKARGVRRCGSACLDFAWLACGRYDGFWELHLEPWDVAAGAALVIEAGGRVTDVAGGPSWLFGRNVVASNGPLHDVLRGEVRPFMPPPA